MALRTSATTKFSDARLAAVEPAVSRFRDQEQPSGTGAAAINAFGTLGGQARLGQLKGGLKQKLGETGNIIDALNDPRTFEIAGPPTAEDEADFERTGVRPINISKADPDGIIDQASEAYLSIARGWRQGKITEERAMVEAEVILRKQIAKAPGFADELRAVARNVLRFDPSGSAIGSLFLSGPSADRVIPLTQLDRDIQMAESFVVSGVANTVADGLSIINMGRTAEALGKQRDHLLAEGELATPLIAQFAAQEMQDNLNGILITAVPELLGTGAVMIKNSQVLKRRLKMARDRIVTKNKIAMAIPNQKIFHDRDDVDFMEAEVEKVFQSGVYFLDNEDQLKILQKHRDLIRTTFETEAFNMFPDLMLAAQIGDAVLQEYVLFLAAIKGDETLRKYRLSINPLWAAWFDKAPGARLEDVGPALRAQHSGRLNILVRDGAIDPLTAELVMEAKALGLADGAVDVEEIGTFIDDTSEIPGKGTLTLTTAAATQGSYEATKPEQRAKVAFEFKRSLPFGKNDVIRALVDTPFLLGWNEDANDGKGELNFQRRDGQEGISDFKRSFLFGSSQVPSVQEIERISAIPVSGEQRGNVHLGLLNDKWVALVRDPNWAKEVGVLDRGEFVNDLIGEINKKVILAELNTDPVNPKNIGNISSLSPEDKQVLQEAINTGSIDEVRKVLSDELNLGDFGQTIPKGQLGPKLEAFEAGSSFIDTKTGEVFTMGEDGQVTAAKSEPSVPEFSNISAQMKTSLALPANIRNVVLAKEAARDLGIREALFLALIQSESDWDANATVSTSSAKGLTQLTDETAAELGVTDPFDPEQSITGGSVYLARHLETYNGNERQALAAYHAGPGAMRKAGGDINKLSNVNTVRERTIEYVNRVMEHAGGPTA